MPARASVTEAPRRRTTAALSSGLILAFATAACSSNESQPQPSNATSGSPSAAASGASSASTSAATGAGGQSSGSTVTSSSASVTGTGGGSASTTGAGGSSAGTTGAGGGAADPTEIAKVSGWLTTTSSGLPNYAYTNIQKNFPTPAAFDALVHAIVMSCTEFAPAEANWLGYCEAVITSAIVAESSYDPNSDVTDTYATRMVNGAAANDPTVGLLQIRFSSTVHDYNYYGPLPKMAAIGCSWPAALEGQADDATFWATMGGTTYLSFMQDPSCNIALATWYYFINATGNGGATATYAAQYCQGQGVAGDMVIGLLSHLQGPGFTRPPDAGNSYVTGIKGRFTSLLGGLPDPDPFTESLAPEPTKFCR